MASRIRVIVPNFVAYSVLLTTEIIIRVRAPKFAKWFQSSETGKATLRIAAVLLSGLYVLKWSEPLRTTKFRSSEVRKSSLKLLRTSELHSSGDKTRTPIFGDTPFLQLPRAKYSRAWTPYMQLRNAHTSINLSRPRVNALQLSPWHSST